MALYPPTPVIHACVSAVRDETSVGAGGHIVFACRIDAAHPWGLQRPPIERISRRRIGTRTTVVPFSTVPQRSVVGILADGVRNRR